MKKLLSAILALSMVFAATVNVNALEYVWDNRDTKNTTHSETQDVTVNLNGTPVTVYYVDVNWQSTTFTYEFSTAEWNPLTHTYTGKTALDETKTITVTNHSNAEVDVKATFANDATTATQYGVTGTLTNNTKTLKTAVGTKVKEAPAHTINLKVTGTPVFAEVTPETIEVGTITVVLTGK